MKDIEVWWKRIGCQRQPSFSTGEQVAMAAEIKELREALDESADYRSLLKKYMLIVSAQANNEFLTAADAFEAQVYLLPEDLYELKVMRKEADRE